MWDAVTGQETLTLGLRDGARYHRVRFGGELLFAETEDAGAMEIRVRDGRPR